MRGGCIRLTRLSALVVALVLAAAQAAEAQGAATGASMHRARREYDAASFSAAVSTLDELLEHGPLTSEELVSALELLALACRGLGDDAALDRALLLISLLPDGESVLARAPPSLRARFAIVRDARVEPQVSLELREETTEALHLSGSVTPEVPHGVVRVHGRTGEGAWQDGEGTLTLRLDSYAEAYATLEIAGVVIRESARQRHAGPVAATTTTEAPEAAFAASESEARDSVVWWTVGVVGVALAIGGVVLGVVLSQPAQTTTVVWGPL